MTEFDCSISFEDIPGDVELQERCAKDKLGYWPSKSLFTAPHGINLTVIFEDGGARFSVDTYHAENKETNRAFHASLKWTLGQQDLARLRDFLAMISKWEDEQ